MDGRANRVPVGDVEVGAVWCRHVIAGVGEGEQYVGGQLAAGAREEHPHGRAQAEVSTTGERPMSGSHHCRFDAYQSMVASMP